MSDATLGSCPIPASRYECITLGHGSGGQLMADLISEVFVPAFENQTLSALEDQATLDWNGSGDRLAFTTDSYVVRPLFFPGGDIGSLAVHGTINDLAVGGATPLALSAGFILEEGLEVALLERITRSMAPDTRIRSPGSADAIERRTPGAIRPMPDVLMKI